MLSLITFMVSFAIIGAILGAAEWFGIRKSQEHILFLKLKKGDQEESIKQSTVQDVDKKDSKPPIVAQREPPKQILPKENRKKELLPTNKDENAAKLEHPKPKETPAYRVELIKQWRDGIESIKDSEWYDAMGISFGDKTWYSSLRQYMKKEAIEGLEKPRTLVVPSEGRKGFPKKQILLDEVARIEKEWGLTGY